MAYHQAVDLEGVQSQMRLVSAFLRCYDLNNFSRKISYRLHILVFHSLSVPVYLQLVW